jgi:hypothetical protein
MIRKILSLEITPRLRSIDLSPGIQFSSLQDLLGWNPVIGSGTETHAFVVVLFPAKVIQPVWEEIVCFGGYSCEVSVRFVREVIAMMDLGLFDSHLLIPDRTTILIDLNVRIGKTSNTSQCTEILQLSVQGLHRQARNSRAERNDFPS